MSRSIPLNSSSIVGGIKPDLFLSIHRRNRPGKRQRYPRRVSPISTPYSCRCGPVPMDSSSVEFQARQQLLEDLTLRSFGSRRAPQDDKLLHGASEMYTPSKLARSSNAPLHNLAVAM